LEEVAAASPQPPKLPLEAAILHQGVPLDEETEPHRTLGAAGRRRTHTRLATDVRLSGVGQKCPPNNLPELPSETQPGATSHHTALPVRASAPRALAPRAPEEHGAGRGTALQSPEAPHRLLRRREGRHVALPRRALGGADLLSEVFVGPESGSL